MTALCGEENKGPDCGPQSCCTWLDRETPCGPLGVGDGAIPNNACGCKEDMTVVKRRGGSGPGMQVGKPCLREIAFGGQRDRPEKGARTKGGSTRCDSEKHETHRKVVAFR